MEGPQFLHLLWAFCQDLELLVALTGRKKPVLGQKKAAKNFLMQIIILNYIKLNSEISTNNQMIQRFLEVCAEIDVPVYNAPSGNAVRYV